MCYYLISHYFNKEFQEVVTALTILVSQTFNVNAKVYLAQTDNNHK